MKLCNWLLKVYLILIYGIRLTATETPILHIIGSQKKLLPSRNQWELFQTNCETHLIPQSESISHGYWPPPEILARGSTDTSCKSQLWQSLTKAQGFLRAVKRQFSATTGDWALLRIHDPLQTFPSSRRDENL